MWSATALYKKALFLRKQKMNLFVKILILSTVAHSMYGIRYLSDELGFPTGPPFIYQTDGIDQAFYDTYLNWQIYRGKIDMSGRRTDMRKVHTTKPSKYNNVHKLLVSLRSGSG